MNSTIGLRRMTNEIEPRPAPDTVLLGGGSGGGISVTALKLVDNWNPPPEGG